LAEVSSIYYLKSKTDDVLIYIHFLYTFIRLIYLSIKSESTTRTTTKVLSNSFRSRRKEQKKKLRYTPFLLKLEEKCRKPSFNLLLLADQPSTFGTSIKKKPANIPTQQQRVRSLLSRIIYIYILPVHLFCSLALSFCTFSDLLSNEKLE